MLCGSLDLVLMKYQKIFGDDKDNGIMWVLKFVLEEILQDLCPLSQQLPKEAQAHASKLESLNTTENLEKKKQHLSGGNLPNVL